MKFPPNFNTTNFRRKFTAATTIFVPGRLYVEKLASVQLVAGSSSLIMYRYNSTWQDGAKIDGAGSVHVGINHTVRVITISSQCHHDVITCFREDLTRCRWKLKGIFPCTKLAYMSMERCDFPPQVRSANLRNRISDACQPEKSSVLRLFLPPTFSQVHLQSTLSHKRESH